MKCDVMQMVHNDERGTALVMVLLMLAMMLALAMGISLTAISELGVSKTYRTQTEAFQVAEAGLNNAVSLAANYNGEDFTALLGLRPIVGAGTEETAPLTVSESNSTNFVVGGDNPLYNPFDPSNASHFASGAEMIASTGRQLFDASNTAIPNAHYYVSLVDDEPSIVPNYNPGVSPENGDPNTDSNNRLVIYSTGTYQNASVTLEGWIAFLPFPALSANRNIEIGGNTTITGAYGGVHSNSDLLSGNGGGNNWWVEQTATASGQTVGTFDSHVGGFYGGGQPPLDLPAFVTTAPVTAGGPNTSPRIQDFIIRKADVILIDPSFANGAHETDSTATDAATVQLANLSARLNVSYSALAAALDTTASNGTVQQTGAVAITIARADDNAVGVPTRAATLASVGWSYNNASNPWNIDNNSAGGHTFYVVGSDNYDLTDLNNPPSLTSSQPNGGKVKLTGNIGNGGPALQVTILSTGSIEIVGNPNVRANLTNLQTPMLPPFVKIDALMMAVQDVKVRGDFSADISFTGITYAGEQVDLSGNGSINGQVIAYGNNNIVGSLVEGPSGDPNRNTITGSFVLTLNQGNSVGRIRLASWRQIKK